MKLLSVAALVTTAAAQSSGPAPAGCTTWFDGCNTCTRTSARGQMTCSMMACFRQGATECRGYAVGYAPASPNADACATSPCLNGGVCQSTASEYSCMCASGFAGVNCGRSAGRPMHPVDPIRPTHPTHPVDPLPPSRCSGCCPAGAACFAPDPPCCAAQQANSGGLEGARCVSGFSEMGIQMPCAAGLTCVRSAGMMCAGTCYGTCSAGNSGPNVYPSRPGQNGGGIRDVCASSPCLNGGRCASRGSRYTCMCQANFLGVNCETSMLAPGTTAGNPACWGGDYTASRCCSNGGNSHNHNGDSACWSGSFNYAFCCASNGH